MDEKKGSGCAAPIIVFLVIIGISVLLQSIWTPTISDFNKRMEMNSKIGTFCWIAAIVIPLIIFIYNYVSRLASEKRKKEEFLRRDVVNSRKRAKEQIIKLNKSIISGNKWQLAADSDYAVECVWCSQTISGAFEYMETIEEANLLYFGNRYPHFRNPNVLLENVIAEEIKRIPGSHFKG